MSVKNPIDYQARDAKVKRFFRWCIDVAFCLLGIKISLFYLSEYGNRDCMICEAPGAPDKVLWYIMFAVLILFTYLLLSLVWKLFK